MSRLHLTAESVNRLPLRGAGQAIYRDTSLPGFGVRVGTTAVAFFVEKRVDGRNVRHTIGLRGQLTAAQARERAQIALGRMTSGHDLNVQRRERREQIKAEQTARAEGAQRNVKALCDWYVKHQTALGKQSATDARGILARYVDGSAFASTPAREFTPKQATALIRSVVEDGKKRTAAKLRAYLRAAFALAQGAETNPQAPAALVLFGVEANPVASTAAIKNACGARDVTLTERELGEALKLLRQRRKERHDDALAAIELSLLLGGQRLAQVLRIEASDVDLRAGTVTLLDPKGRRETARRHVLPLTPAALDLIKATLKVRRADWLFGDKAARTSPDTVARKGVQLLAEAQANTQRSGVERPKLEPRDLRRTAETMLAQMGISKDVRAQLLSHGLGGVQARHYDQHDYMTEKRAALTAWSSRLQALAAGKTAPSNVRRLARAA